MSFANKSRGCVLVFLLSDSATSGPKQNTGQHRCQNDGHCWRVTKCPGIVIATRGFDDYSEPKARSSMARQG